MQSILNFEQTELLDWLNENAQPTFRAGQILQWIYKHEVTDFSQMSNVGKPLHEKLSATFVLRAGTRKRRQESPDGTIKLLLQWPDDSLTETVLMHARNRHTVCVSTQVGCPVQCSYCASGLTGLERDLTTGEIVEQVLRACEELSPNERLSNVVIMGMGEPLANYDATLKAIRIINADWGLGIGARHITLSTIGLPDQIRRLADEPLQITLAVSLHAPNDTLRRQIIPWANNISIDDIFIAINDYYEKTHREVTLEYILLDGINDEPRQADQLADLVHRTRCNVNLIIYNAVAETGFRPAKPEKVEAFISRLQTRGVNVHLRRSQGIEIDAACGQLRRRSLS